MARQMSEGAVYVGFDPGKDKCGLAVVSAQGQVVARQVVAAAQALASLQGWVEQYQPAAVILGDRTTSRQWQARLRAALGPAAVIVPVNEHRSTLEARDRYWQATPPRGWARLLPEGLRSPPEPVDDWVAVILVERYLGDRLD